MQFGSGEKVIWVEVGGLRGFLGFNTGYFCVWATVESRMAWAVGKRHAHITTHLNSKKIKWGWVST